MQDVKIQFDFIHAGNGHIFYNWGVYVGYSMTFVLLIAEKSLGWRRVYVLVGAPGVCLALVVMATIREPVRDEKDGGQKVG